MKKITMAMLVAVAMMTGCQASSMNKVEGTTMTLTQENFLHHNWILKKINGETISVLEGMNEPNLEIGENFTVNGNNGCNRYFGQGELNGNQFRIDKMGSTMMACPPEATELENAMSDVLKDWSDVTLDKETLTLKNSAYTLEFALRDWVN